MRMTNVVPAHCDRSGAKLRDRRIGALLVQAGRLRPGDRDEVLRLHHENGLRFGDAGKELGLLTQDDVDFALARQFDHPFLQPGESDLSAEVLAVYQPLSAQVEAMRTVRSQLMLRWLENGPERKAIAVVSAARKEGRSFIAANLAVVFAQLGQRTLLIDADLRNASQHRLFGVDNRLGLSAVLSGRADASEAIQRVAAVPNLSLLP